MGPGLAVFFKSSGGLKKGWAKRSVFFDPVLIFFLDLLDI
jgi:hypothetical protein